MCRARRRRYTERMLLVTEAKAYGREAAHASATGRGAPPPPRGGRCDALPPPPPPGGGAASPLYDAPRRALGLVDALARAYDGYSSL